MDEDRWIQPPTDTVSTKDLEVLMPTLSARLEDVGSDFRLVTDANGEMWSVRRGDSRIVLAKLDRDGTAVEEHSFGPPNGTQKPERYEPIDLYAVGRGSGESRSVIEVIWARGCESQQQGLDDCQFSEALVFDDFGDTPMRTDLDTYSGLIANESGNWRVYGDHIDKYDARGNLVWRQTAFLALEHPEVSWTAHGALRPNNELSVLLAGATNSSSVSVELWRVDSRGNIAQRRLVAWGGEGPLHALDREGHDVLVGSQEYRGDLVMMRVLSDNSVDGNWIERADYLTLRPDHLTLDSDNAAYATALVGGRETKDIRAMLCQLPMSGKVRCFALGDLTATQPFSMVDDLVTPEPGVVYVRTGSDLRRYELPAS